MIKDLKFEFNLDDINVDIQIEFEFEIFDLSEQRKITDHYDTCTSIEKVEAVKILIEKINVVNVLNWQLYFHVMALQCDNQSTTNLCGEGFPIPDPTNHCRSK